MIKSIKLKNFQSHVDSEIEFSDQDTVIVGSSDSGKTSIIRAIEWVRTNRPLGSSFIRKGETHCSVELTILVDGKEVVIKRMKGRGSNVYSIDGEVFEAPGSGVPERVGEILNLGALNIQTQLESPFMVLDSPGKVAQTINAVTHLEEADKVVTRLMSMIKDNKAETTRLEEVIVSLEEQQKAPVYGLLDDFEMLCNKYENTEKRIDVNERWIQDVSGILDSLAGVEDLIESEQVGVSKFEVLTDIEQLFVYTSSGVEEKLKYKCALDLLITGMVSNEEAIQKVEVKRSCFVDIPDTRVSELTDRLNKTRAEYGSIALVLKDFGENERWLQSEEELFRTLTVKWNRLLAEMKECPVCGSELDDDQKILAVENLR